MFVIFIIRTLQALLAGAVLALSIHAWQWQELGPVPTTTVFAAIAGGFAIIASLVGLVVGLVAIWISITPVHLIMSVVDGFASILLLAGGIVSQPRYHRRISGVAGS